jgi:hypothetical protein
MPAFVNGFLLDKDLPAAEDKLMLTRLLGTTSDPDVRVVTVAEQQQLACVKISTDMVQPGRGVAYTRQYGPFDPGVDPSVVPPRAHGMVGAIAQRRSAVGSHVEEGVVRDMLAWLKVRNPIVRAFYSMYELAKDVRELLPSLPGLGGEGLVTPFPRVDVKWVSSLLRTSQGAYAPTVDIQGDGIMGYVINSTELQLGALDLTKDEVERMPFGSVVLRADTQIEDLSDHVQTLSRTTDPTASDPTSHTLEEVWFVALLPDGRGGYR